MDTLIISSGVVSSGLTADITRDIIVLGGGTLSDSIATNSGMIYTDSDYTDSNVHGGVLQRITATGGGEVWVYNYGSALEITAENKSYFNIVEGSLVTGLVQSGGYGLVFNDATADNVTVADGGKFYNLGGTVRSTVVSSGGSFIVQDSSAATSGTLIHAGGVMRIVSAGNATDTTVNGGFLEVDSGTAAKTVVSAGSARVNQSNTIESAILIGGYLEVDAATAVAPVISGGSMRVSSGGVATGAAVNGGELEIASASADAAVVNGGVMRVTSEGVATGVTVNAGQFEVISASAADTTVQAGTANFTGAAISGLGIGSGGTVTMDSTSTLTGKAVFADGASITVDGSVTFDTSLTTSDAAQITGYSAVTNGENAAYSLTVAEAKAGLYLLATDAAEFKNDVVFGEYTLAIGAEAVKVNDLYYMLSLVDDGSLVLTISEEEPEPPTPILAYVNSEWTGKEPGTVVTVGTGTAKIGYNAFAELAPAIAAVTDDGAVEVVGGEISFADGYSKTVTVDTGATVVGKATFDKAITINGTVAFNTAETTASAAQFGGFSFVSGSEACTLTADAAVTGTYLLAADAASFDRDVVFGDATLKVGAEATVVGDYTYALAITDNSELALTIADKPEPPPTVTPAKSDIDANGISDVMFQYTGGFGQIGFWMNGTNEWKSTNTTHPVDTWEVLGAYDMNANGKADSVLVGNVEVSGIKGAFIGYYTDAEDLDANWVNISYLTNFEGYVWKNKVGNLTGNEGMNSIVWHTTDLGALGVWTDGTDNWISLGAGFDANWEMVGCGDFSGSGKDSVVMSYAGGQVYYVVGIEATDFLTNSDLGWVVRAIGDFSGDGKDDIVAFHEETGLVAMWGDGTTANWSLLGQLDAADWFVVGAGDYNNDAKDDLLVRQYSTGMLGYYSSGDMTQWTELGRGVDMSWTVIA